MNQFLENLVKELNVTKTENGAIAFKSTLNKNLDFYGLASSAKNDDLFKELLNNAWEEDKKVALANLFYLRDVRGGAGRRHLFRVALNELIKVNKKEAFALIPFIEQYGRLDDLLVFVDNPETRKEISCYFRDCLEFELNSGETSLLAKWMPSLTASNQTQVLRAKQIVKNSEWTEKEYRKTLSTLRERLKIVERDLTNKNYENIEYAKLPSKALLKYSNLFSRQDEQRFSDFVKNKPAKSQTVDPHEVVRKVLEYVYYEKEPDLALDYLEKTWGSMSLPNTEDERIIVVRDGSGSMMGQPLEIATALAIKYSECLKGAFANKFITFSEKPALVDLTKCRNLKEKIEKAYNENEVANTNIEAVFKLILETAKKTDKEYCPTKIVIISDMEFDDMTTENSQKQSMYDYFKEKFEEEGLVFPHIVFWNVNARNIHFPTTNLSNVSLISGFSKAVMSNVLTNKEINGVDFMMTTLEKYNSLFDVANILKDRLN